MDLLNIAYVVDSVVIGQPRFFINNNPLLCICPSLNPLSIMTCSITSNPYFISSNGSNVRWLLDLKALRIIIPNTLLRSAYGNASRISHMAAVVVCQVLLIAPSVVSNCFTLPIAPWYYRL